MKPIECPPWAQGIQYVVQYLPRSNYPAQEFSPWPISAHSADWIGIENAKDNIKWKVRGGFNPFMDQ